MFRLALAGSIFCCGLALVQRCESAELALSSTSVKQGQTFEVTVNAGGDADAPEVSFLNRKFKTFPQEDAAGVYKALLVAPALQAPGKYEVSCGDVRQSVQVQPGKFGVQHIHLPKSKNNFDGSPGESEAVDKAKATLSPERFWHSAFVAPCKARISSTFGLRRAVNGKMLADYFHSGVDYAGSLGTPVTATAPGKVILARRGWKLHGNCVCIDHGQGVVSFYIHLNTVLVKEGQMVDMREKIGTVGCTGRANGPHLHFSLYVNNDATSPGDWFARTF